MRGKFFLVRVGPKEMAEPNPIAEDLHRLKGLLKQGLEREVASATDLRILNLACGRCDEA